MRFNPCTKIVYLYPIDSCNFTSISPSFRVSRFYKVSGAFINLLLSNSNNFVDRTVIYLNVYAMRPSLFPFTRSILIQDSFLKLSDFTYVTRIRVDDVESVRLPLRYAFISFPKIKAPSFRR